MRWNPEPILAELDLAWREKRALTTTGLACLGVAVALLWHLLVVAVDRHVPLAIAGRHVCPPRVITYCVSPSSRDPDGDGTRAAVRQAARAWNRRSRFEFREVDCRQAPRVRISFSSSAEHDRAHPEAPFGRHLAHATYPEGSDQFIHVNDDIDWLNSQGLFERRRDLAATIEHEMGHLLGLEHNASAPGTLMHPYNVQARLDPRDLARLRALEERCFDADDGRGGDGSPSTPAPYRFVAP